MIKAPQAMRETEQDRAKREGSWINRRREARRTEDGRGRDLLFYHKNNHNSERKEEHCSKQTPAGRKRDIVLQEQPAREQEEPEGRKKCNTGSLM